MSEPVNGGNGAAPDGGAGPAAASVVTESGDTQPPAAGSALAEKSDGSESINGGNGEVPDGGAGPAAASVVTGSGDTQPPGGGGAFIVAPYFLSGIQWAGEFVKDNPDLIDKAATALANRKQRLSQREAKDRIKKCLEATEELAKPLGEPAEGARRLSRATQLYMTNRFTELEGHYISIRAELLASVTTNPDRATDKYAQSAAESLQSAYRLLTKRESSNAAANYLSQADAFTASTLTGTQAAERANMLLALLNADTVDKDDDSLRTSLKGVVDKHEELSEEAIKGTLVAAIRRQWAANCGAHLAEDLQVARMKFILRWLTATLLGLIIVVPLVIGRPVPSSATTALTVSESQTTFVWPMLRSVNIFAQSYIVVLAIALIGCVGGTLSALLAARDSRMRLLTYRTDMQRALMRPIMGAVVAVLVYALLTWQVIPGVTVTSAGTYLFVALLAGFSERFFLGLLPVEGSSPEDGVAHRDSSPRIV